jgi:hypothetical protein
MQGAWKVLCAANVVLLAALVSAQTAPPQPAPELKKLDFLTGNWSAEGDIKPNPSVPSGAKFSTSTQAEWMEGKYFLIEHSDIDFSEMGKMKELAVLGYDPEHKVYTYTAFNSMGQEESANGTLEGDTWTWLSDEHMGGATMKGRFTMKVLSPSSYQMKFELSQDGTHWTAAMEGKATKK